MSFALKKPGRLVLVSAPAERLFPVATIADRATECRRALLVNNMHVILFDSSALPPTRSMLPS
jgi:hypothetical protein